MTRRTLLVWLCLATAAFGRPVQPSFLDDRCVLVGFGKVPELLGVRIDGDKICLYFEYENQQKSESVQRVLDFLNAGGPVDFTIGATYKSFGEMVGPKVYKKVSIGDSYGSFGVVNNQNYYVIELDCGSAS